VFLFQPRTPYSSHASHSAVEHCSLFLNPQLFVNTNITIKYFYRAKYKSLLIKVLTHYRRIVRCAGAILNRVELYSLEHKAYYTLYNFTRLKIAPYHNVIRAKRARTFAQWIEWIDPFKTTCLILAVLGECSPKIKHAWTVADDSGFYPLVLLSVNNGLI